jgi:dTDP-4-dehydrorhamnose reductase
MRILVLGGSGNLGEAITNRALARGNDVAWTFSSLPTGSVPGSAFQWNVLDGFPPADLQAFRPDIVIHAIAIIDPDACEKEPERAFRINADSVRIALEALQPRYFIYISSDYVFDGIAGNNWADSNLNPINRYGLTKQQGEIFTRAAAQWLIVRTSMFGSASAGRITRTEQMLLALSQGKEIAAASDQIGTPMWTSTVADLIVELAERQRQGIAHLAGPEAISKADLARRLADRAEIRSSRILPTCSSRLRSITPRPLNVSLIPSDDVMALAGYPKSLEAEVQHYVDAVWKARVF